MDDRDDEHDQHPVADLVDDAVITGAHPPFALAAGELLRSGGARIIGQ